MKPIKVVFQPRIQNFLADAGGGLKRQVLKTKEFLEKDGCEVTISLKHKEDLSRFDVVHLFSPDTYFQAINTKRFGIPVALSTIYWVDRYPDRDFFSRIKQQLLFPWRGFKAATDTLQFKSSRRELFRQRIADLRIDALTQHKLVLKVADIWLPNGQEEYQKIVANTGIEKESNVIPNAIDEGLLHIEETKVPVPPGDYALCVAAITPRKNQLKLIQIADEFGINLVLAGSFRKGLDGYFEECANIANSNVFFTGELNDQQLAYLYRRARIHVLPSIYETPGLSSLEAALFGCPVVTTSIGAVREYFGDNAFYCNPYDYASIKEAVAKAWRAPKNELFSQYVREHYTWEVASRMTLAVYRKLLAQRE